jgi:signal peptidase I
MDNSLTEPPFTPVWARKYKESIFFIYNGTSMAPLFKPGDLLCARRHVWGNIHPGDIVIVNWGSSINHSENVVHRVVSVRRDNLITRGDNNLKPDSEMASKNNLVGLVVAFGRHSHIYSAKGGRPGLFYARLIHLRNYICMLIKCLGRRVYRQVQQSGLSARVWRPTLSRIHVMTDEGPLVKYCFGTRTVARWWPQQKRFDVVKPFDLVLSAPEELK